MILFPTADEDYQYFVSEGYNGSINDMHYQALGDIGYTGSYTDRLYSHLTLTYGDYHQALADLRSGVSTFSLLGYAVGGVEPDLVLNFAADYYRTGGVVSTFNDSLTYTGASAKTMVDSDGLLKWAPHNLARQSEFASGWTTYQATNSNGVLTESSSVQFQSVWQSGPTDVQTRTLKCKFVPNGRNFAHLSVGPTSGNWAAATFDVVNGTVTKSDSSGTGTLVSASIVADGEGFMCGITVSGIGANYYYVGSSDTGTTAYGSYGLVSFQGSGATSLTVSKAHLYRSDLGGMVNNPDRGDSYVPTTSAAVYLPRRGHHIYNGSTWVNEGIQLESEARTNVVPYSEDFSNAAWTKQGSTISTYAAPSPTGASTDAKTVTGTGVSAAAIYDLITATGGSRYTWSFWAKAGTTDWVALGTFDGTLDVKQYYDLTNGVVGSAQNGTFDNAGMVNYGNGWYRCWATRAIGGTATNVRIQLNHATADLTSALATDTFTLHHYGAQLELGSTPSSYIPTAGATVTRAAETLLAPNAVIGDYQTKGSALFIGNAVDSSIDTNAVWIGLAGSGNDFLLRSVTVNQAQASLPNNSVSIGVPGLSAGSFKAAAWYDTSLPGVSISLNGAAAESDLVGSTGDLGAGFDLQFMAATVNQYNTIKQVSFWPDVVIGDTGIAEAST